VFLGVLGGSVAFLGVLEEKNQGKRPKQREESMIHELRIYHCMPGKLPEVNKRFETITLKLFEKHGIRQAGFWTVLVGPSNRALYYLLEWKDMAEREQKWGAFMADPEWLAKRAETERNGPLVDVIENMFLAPTAYSSIR
jgi:hypothetical protein